MTKIKQDRRNYRVHNDENKRVIRKSLEDLGAGRSIVIDNDGEIIAGNGVYEQAKKLGIKTKIVETDGSELVVVKRTDLATGDDKRKKLALADNAASDTSEWADELLREDWTPEVLADFGIVLPEVKATERLSKLEFTGLYYEPKDKPDIRLQDCFDTTKYDAKISAIENMDLPDETKAILRVFAYRFIKIDFESVANYYAFKATENEKKAIERLRLVLVDGGIQGFIEDDMLRITQDMITFDNDDE